MAQIEGEFGPQGDFASLGLAVQSHKENEFTVKTNVCEIKFKSTKPVKFTQKMVNVKDEEDDLSSYVFSQKYDDCMHFCINFPESGSYKFQLFALPGDTKETSLPNVFNYKIKVEGACHAVHAFPKQYAQWKDGCSLVEPTVLNSNCSLTSVKFKVNIPNAKAAAIVINGSDWKHLDKAGCCFTGTYDLHKLRNSGAKVTLNANFDEGSGSYPTLLEYKI
ncbi:uncharacterized protein [Haliotis cracherodii]|uniref:uncharacterized protein n=1 Tax=Haliotis cracherodii TaxID=6455 RepID=UPI0039EA3EA4